MKKINTSLIISSKKNEVYHQKCWEKYNESIGYADTGILATIIDLSDTDSLIVTGHDSDGNPNQWELKE